jgi:hypothetical protein
LALTSCSAELGLGLRSAYLDGGGSGEILVAEVAVLGGACAELSSRRLEGVKEVFTYERRRLLYDHLQALQNLAARADVRLAFGIEASVAVLDPYSRFISAS